MKALGGFTSLYVPFLDEKTEVPTGVPCQRAERHVTTTVFELGGGPSEREKVAPVRSVSFLCGAGTQGIIPAAPRDRPSTSKRGSPHTSLDSGAGGAGCLLALPVGEAGAGLPGP